MIETLPPQDHRVFINTGVQFIHVSALRMVMGWEMQRLKRRIDKGELLWVFNFSMRIPPTEEPRINAMRFWIGELADPSGTRKLTFDEFLKNTLGTLRQTFSPGDVCSRFSISRTQLMLMRRLLNVEVGSFKRKILAEFLEMRWLDANPQRLRFYNGNLTN